MLSPERSANMRLGRFGVENHCQTNEESVLLNLLDELLPIPRYIVHVGLGDGGHLSDTRIFVERGWQSCRIDRDSDSLRGEFVDKDNATSLLRKFSVPPESGVPSLDIDEDDIYVFEFDGSGRPWLPRRNSLRPQVRH